MHLYTGYIYVYTAYGLLYEFRVNRTHNRKVITFVDMSHLPKYLTDFYEICYGELRLL
jgi:hypothetical protein